MDEQQGWQYGLSKGGVQGDVEIINAGKNLSATAIMSNPPLSEELFKQLIGNDKYSIIVTNMTPTNDFLDYAKANNIVVAVINVPVSDVLKEAVKNGKLASMVYAEGVVDYSYNPENFLAVDDLHQVFARNYKQLVGDTK
ncbi:MAG: hypothetical protein RRY34_05440 [Victivallaceae bacterium]